MVTFDAEAFRNRFLQHKAQKREIEARHRAAAKAEMDALDVALDRMVLDVLLGGEASLSQIAASIPTSRSSIYHLKNRALEREGMSEEDYLQFRYAAKREESKAAAGVFRIRTLHRGNLHVTIPSGADPTGYEMQNVFLDPREYRVLNVSPHENGTQPMMSGEAVDAWQAELDTPGSTLRNTVDRHNDAEG